ncbi:Myotubularin- protein 14 [Actinomortierella ambigua]|nr:Myotubularin- protein 14 [Actinomortierella ambigua]
MSTSNLCQQSQVHRLYSLYLHFDASHSAKHEDPECKAVLDQCFQLFEKDYIVGRVDNRNGQLCSTYPAELAILEGERDNPVREFGFGNLEPASSRDHLEHAQSDSLRDLAPAADALSAAHHPPQQPLHTDISIEVAPQTSTSKASSRSPPPPLFGPAGATDPDRSFDLDDSSMMSFQDVRAELDQAYSTSNVNFGRRNILPFPFRITPIKSDHALKCRTASPSSVPLPQSPPPPRSRAVHDPSLDTTHKVPCILVRGKNVCRSGTLSNEVEVFMHNVNQKFNDLNQKRKTFMYGAGEKSPDKEDRESSLTKQRSEDIALLHRLGVAYINDLMVENRKVKYGLKVTSSEKVDSFGRYSSFKLVSTPYPGVEFFQKFKANKYSARKLCFDWSQTFADADLQLPDEQSDILGISWKDYKQWDLIELTQNYLRWDRTPLFISLLRISLWADGEIHSSLSAAELLYLTIGYDWFLFNHLLADRSSKGEDIFYFCFYFLKFIYMDDFSLQNILRVAQEKSQTVGTKTSSPPEGSVNDMCENCRCLSPSERVRLYGGSCGDTGGSAPKNDASSSVEGKPSSWQFVSFAAGPAAMTSISSNKDCQPRYGSPHGTPSAMGGPHTLSSRHVSVTGTPSPSRGGFRTAFQNFANSSSQRRSSSSYLSNHSPGQYSTTPSKLGGCEMMRTATSPHLGSDMAVGNEGSETHHVGDKPERSPRKRASTFDGGLLIGTGSGAMHSNDGHESDDEDDEDEDDMEDLTSGDDAEHDESGHGNLFIPSHPADVPQKSTIPGRPTSPYQRQYQECRHCHQRYAVTRPRHMASHPDSCDGTERTSASVATLEKEEVTMRYVEDNRMGGGVGDSSFSSYPGDKDRRHLRSRDQYPADSDREEVFQLEIEDNGASATNNSSRISSHLQADRSQRQRLSSILSPAMGRKQRSFLDLLQADQRAEDEHDESENEVSGPGRDGSTGSRGHFSLSEGEWDHQSSSSRNASYFTKRPSSSSSFGKGCDRRRSCRSALGEDEDEDDDDDDDDDDDEGEEGMAGSLASIQCGLNLEQLQNDRMFMPSLQGVFSSSDESVGFVGSSAKKGRAPPVTREEEGLTKGVLQQRQQQPSQPPLHEPQLQRQQQQQKQRQQQQQKQLHRESRSSSRAGEPCSSGHETTQQTESPKRSTRRQRLREIRRLFMEMRHELGDGSQAPSRSGRHLLVAAAATASSAVAGATGVTGNSGSGSNGHIDDSSDQLSPSGLTDDSSASSFPFVFDLPRHHHQRHRRGHSDEQYHNRRQRHASIPENPHQEASHGHHTDLSAASTSSSSHNYVASFFGTKLSSPTPRDAAGGGGGASATAEEASLSVPSVGSGRKSPLEWAAAAAASISAGIALHGSQQQVHDPQQQPIQQHQPSDTISHLRRPSIPEVPTHLLLDDSQVSLDSFSSHPPSRTRVGTKDDIDDHRSLGSHHHHDRYQHANHRRMDREEEHDDPEPFHDEDSIDYSVSFIDSSDAPSSASLLHSEDLFTSTLAGASSGLEHYHHQRRPGPPAMSPPMHRAYNVHRDHHHHHVDAHVLQGGSADHHVESRERERRGSASTTGPNSVPSPTSQLSWQDDGTSPSPSYSRRTSGDHGLACPSQRMRTVPTSSATAVATHAMGITATSATTSAATPPRSTPPVSAALPRFRGAKERGENGWLKDW